MKLFPYISIIIATFNSGKSLPIVLASLRRQSYPRNRTEILIVDGGSTDQTLSIAKRFGCMVLQNSRILPYWAKFIGFTKAKGHYVVFLDSDEVMENSRSLEQKVQVFQRNPTVRMVTGDGYKSPKGYIFINSYLNEFGDPFSFFFYRLSKDWRFFVKSMKKRYRVVKDDKHNIIFDFQGVVDLPIFEAAAMGSMVDRVYLTNNFPELLVQPGLLWHIFNLLVSAGSHIAITKNDVIVHYSADTCMKYLGKIKSRVIINIFTKAQEGFAGRVKFSKSLLGYKKYLFIPYSFSLFFPFFDSLYLSITRRDIRYFYHIPLCLYTASLILYYTCLKYIGMRPTMKSYGEEKVVASYEL